MKSAVSPQTTVALCSNATIFSENQILRHDIAEKYPGALWVTELIDMLAPQRIGAVTGDVALRQVIAGKLDPSSVWVVQEDISSDADLLIELGANGKVLICCESPLFAANFYQNLKTLSQKFEHCIIFRGSLEDTVPTVKAHVMFFPSFDSAKYTLDTSWKSRKYLVMVAGNKYWKIRRSIVRGFAANMRDILYQRPKRFSNALASAQLHDHRLAAISYFGRRGELDLFGDGWRSLQNLPLRWQNELSATITRLNPSPSANKLATIADYKFALCFENVKFPGYVTEKLIDCLVAGVVPIYLGAPDIRDFVPEDCYIDAQKFCSFEQLTDYLEGMSKENWQRVRDCGKSFLNGNLGNLYSYTGFAERIESMLLNEA